MGSKAIILLSGGLDSATAMWKVKDSYSDLYALTFAYGSKDEEAALTVSRKLADLAGAHYNQVTLPWLEEFSKNHGSALVSEKELPSPEIEELDETTQAKATAAEVWVPARNLVFLSIAASFAESLGGDVDIVVGFNREEAATFPDNSPEFLVASNEVLKNAVLAKDIKVIAPLIDLDKSSIAALAIDFGVPIEYTSSCYRPLALDKAGRPIHCGVCESCQRRKRGFRNAGVDRTVYSG